uniref:Uncharacterized protein n=1 Tax=Panagrolaimus sp. JU765 TaxID=591449 RepID=A0AC34QWC3_9BILA
MESLIAQTNTHSGKFLDEKNNRTNADSVERVQITAKQSKKTSITNKISSKAKIKSEQKIRANRSEHVAKKKLEQQKI